MINIWTKFMSCCLLTIVSTQVMAATELNKVDRPRNDSVDMHTGLSDLDDVKISEGVLRRIHLLAQNKKRGADNSPNSATDDIVNLNTNVYLSPVQGTKRHALQMSEERLIEILHKIPNLKAHFFKNGDVKVKLKKLGEEQHGSSTDFLYLVQEKLNVAEGKPEVTRPLFLIKGISSNNAKEAMNLRSVNVSKVLRHIPLTPDFPILTRPEALYRYNVTNVDGTFLDHAYLSVLHLAKGTPLNALVKELGLAGEDEILREIFYQIGVSLASFNLHCAESGPDVSIEALNEKMKMGHEDLHFGNIFIKENIHGQFRVYLIDNETLGRKPEDSWFRDPKTEQIQRIYGQLYQLYGWSIFSFKWINYLNPDTIYSMYCDGFIKGYASKFAEDKRPEVIAYLLNGLTRINGFYLDLSEGRKPVTKNGMEESIVRAMKKPELLSDPKTFSQVVAVQGLLGDETSASLTKNEIKDLANSIVDETFKGTKNREFYSAFYEEIEKVAKRKKNPQLKKMILSKGAELYRKIPMAESVDSEHEKGKLYGWKSSLYKWTEASESAQKHIAKIFGRSLEGETLPSESLTYEEKASGLESLYGTPPEVHEEEESNVQSHYGTPPEVHEVEETDV